MRSRTLLLAAAGGVAGLVFAGASSGWFASPWAAGRDSGRLALGRELYSEHCASCHGASLEGQPDWQRRKPDGRMPAPPHDETGHTWHHSDQDLLVITKKGVAALVPGYESDMPAFEGILSDEEIRAVLAYIKSTWPERQRRYQEARNKKQQ